MNISFRQLELFLALARTLSFSLAAKECNVSQSALSASIKKARNSFGRNFI
jgi:DNA-binding transcriptional LysR family regulator